MRRQVLCAALSATFFLFVVVGTAAPQDTKAKKVDGSDFLHPIYLPAVAETCAKPSPETVCGVGDTLLHPDLVYALRLYAGQELTAKISSESKPALDPRAMALNLVDGKATSFSDAQRLDHKLAVLDSNDKAHPAYRASIVYVAPETGDYFLVAEFHAAGIVFQLKASAARVLPAAAPLGCFSGVISELDYSSQDVPNNLISYLTIVGPQKPDDPLDYNMHFCLTTCDIQPPTSHVLTNDLTNSFKYNEKKTDTKDTQKVNACWDSSKTITQVKIL